MTKAPRHPEKLLLQHVLEFGGRLTRSLRNRSKTDFLTTPDLSDAALYRTQVVGEAMGELPPAFRKKHRQIRWEQWIGVRHKLVHGYEAVDLELIWALGTTELPKVLIEVEKLVSAMK